MLKNQIIFIGLLLLAACQLLSQEILDKSFGGKGYVTIKLDSIIDEYKGLTIDSLGNCYVLGRSICKSDEEINYNGNIFHTKTHNYFLSKIYSNGLEVESIQNERLFNDDENPYTTEVGFVDNHIFRRLSDKVQLYDLDMSLIEEYSLYSQDTIRRSNRPLQFLDFKSSGNLIITYGTELYKFKEFSELDRKFGDEGYASVSKYFNLENSKIGLRAFEYKETIKFLGLRLPKRDSAILVHLRKDGEFIEHRVIPYEEYNSITINHLIGYPEESKVENIEYFTSLFPNAIIESARKYNENAYLVRLSNLNDSMPFICAINSDGELYKSFADNGVLELKELGGFTHHSYPWEIGYDLGVYMLYSDVAPEDYVENENVKYRLYKLDLSRFLEK